MGKKKKVNFDFSVVSVASLLSTLLMLQNFFISSTTKVRSIQNFCCKARLKKNALKIYCRVSVLPHL